MNKERFQLIFFSLLILIVVGLNFFVFLPYFSVLFLALVFAVLFYPLYRYVLKYVHYSSIASCITVALVFFIIVGPLSFLATLLLREASSLYFTLGSLKPEAVASGPLTVFAESLNRYVPRIDVKSLEVDISRYGAAALSFIIAHASEVASSIANLTFKLFLMLITLFYFLQDGKVCIDFLVRASPLSDVEDRKILSKMVASVHAIVGGSIAVAIVEGFLMGLGFLIFGIPSPVLFGTAAAVAAFVPIFGPSIIFVPAAVFLFLVKGPMFGLGLAVWGFVISGYMGSVVAPMAMNRGIHIHPILILFSVLGGIGYFGVIGFIAGPVFLSLLFALLQVYPSIMSGKKPTEVSIPKKRTRIF